MGSADRMVPGFVPSTMDERQFSGASDHSDSEALPFSCCQHEICYTDIVLACHHHSIIHWA